MITSSFVYLSSTLPILSVLHSSVYIIYMHASTHTYTHANYTHMHTLKRTLMRLFGPVRVTSGVDRELNAWKIRTIANAALVVKKHI